MKGKSIGLILLLSLVLSLIPVMGANAAPPSDEDFKEAAIDYMLSNHPELEAVDSDDWDFTLLGFTTRWLKMKLTFASGPDEPPTYDLEWVGVITWSKYWPLYGDISVAEIYYSYEVELTVAKVGPGTTISAPGVYYVTGGQSYEFTAVTSISTDEDWRFLFKHWSIDDGVTTVTSEDKVLSGVASTDLTITAVFETRLVTSCWVVYEDGLNMAYLWRDDHMVLAIRPNGASTVIVTIESDYGSYSRVFEVSVRSLVIYFSPAWFEGDYTLTVLASNGVVYTPPYMLAG